MVMIITPGLITSDEWMTLQLVSLFRAFGMKRPGVNQDPRRKKQRQRCFLKPVPNTQSPLPFFDNMIIYDVSLYQGNTLGHVLGPLAPHGIKERFSFN